MIRVLRTIPAALAVGFLWMSPVSGASPAEQATVPADIQAPAGYTRVLQTVGNGVQIYDCVDGAWKFREPEATIIDNRNGEEVGRHYAGPTWESTGDGSKVVGAVKARHDAPAAQADIPWLLLEATSNAGSGLFAEVAYIQRLDTVGGATPTDACYSGSTARVPYQATYDFWAPSK